MGGSISKAFAIVKCRLEADKARNDKYETCVADNETAGSFLYAGRKKGRKTRRKKKM